MVNFKHPNILQLVGVCLSDHVNFLVLELMEGGDLKRYLEENKKFSKQPISDFDILNAEDFMDICIDVARGCTYLEEIHFVHRDLAARNCLVSSHRRDSRVIKVGDFGLARDIYKNDYYRKEGEAMLPIRWMPPESLVDGVFTSHSDVSTSI